MLSTRFMAQGWNDISTVTYINLVEVYNTLRNTILPQYCDNIKR